MDVLLAKQKCNVMYDGRTVINGKLTDDGLYEADCVPIPQSSDTAKANITHKRIRVISDACWGIGQVPVRCQLDDSIDTRSQNGPCWYDSTNPFIRYQFSNVSRKMVDPSNSKDSSSPLSYPSKP